MFIQDLIRGSPRTMPEEQVSRKRFLFDIVANKRNSVDVDKFDYILRDCHNVGVNSSLDIRRLIKFSRVIDDQICYSENVAFNLYEMFHARYALFRQVYTHRTVRTIDLMIADALLAADSFLGISASVDDMSRYQHITDSIIKQIEKSQCPELAESRDIVKRIRTRDLYELVDQIKIGDKYENWKQMITNQAIHQNAESPDDFSENDLIIAWHELGYAMKDRNPIDAVRFFNKKHPDHSFHVDRDNVSSFLPHMFEERHVSIFARTRGSHDALKKAFRKMLSQPLIDVFDVEN